MGNRMTPAQPCKGCARKGVQGEQSALHTHPLIGVWGCAVHFRLCAHPAPQPRPRVRTTVVGVPMPVAVNKAGGANE